MQSIFPCWRAGTGIIPQPNSTFVYNHASNTYDVFSLETILHLERITGKSSVLDIASSLGEQFSEVPLSHLLQDTSRITAYLRERGYVDLQNGMAPESFVPIEYPEQSNAVKVVHADIDLTRNCNLRCSYCYASAGLTYLDTPGDVWIDKLDILRSRGLRAVTVSGGEPTMHPDFREVFSHCAEHFLTTLNTNGARINNQWADWLAPLDLQTVQVSLDSDTPRAHDAERGRGSWKSAVKAIERLVARDIPVRVSCTVHAGNASRLPDIRALIESLGAIPAFEIMKPVGRAKEKDGEQFLSSACDVIGANSVPEVYRMLDPLEIHCQAQLGFIGISSNCNAKPCNLTEDFFRELRAPVVEQIPDHFQYDTSGVFTVINEACKTMGANKSVDEHGVSTCILQGNQVSQGLLTIQRRPGLDPEIPSSS